VSTVRPETIFADVAVAVNPKDERYRHLLGKNVIVPLGNQVVPIIADDYVDIEFGTGCLKVTPAHDINDYEIGIRHGLEMPSAINADATLSDICGEFAGMERFKARRAVAKKLEETDLLEEAKDYTHNMGYSERGGEPVEPLLSDQWFVNMKPLAEPALKAVVDGEVKFYPEHWVKTYEHWMTNVRDWCISRQLWWGHRIPVYYTEDGRHTAARNEDEARIKLGVGGEVALRQDEDVLDTWFSSWLWPLTTTGWRGEELRDENMTADMKFYLPTDLLVTGPDIIFFWVARMIMAMKKFHGGVPFKDVYFTSIIRDGKGRKLSKSLGNSPDPLDILDKYGADAVRFTMIYLSPLGSDVRLDIDEKTQDIPSMELGRNFANKVWNACRFLQMKRAEAQEPNAQDPNTTHQGTRHQAPGTLSEDRLSTADRWILSRYHSTVKEATAALEAYRITDYARILYDFVWRDFCDWYVEVVKVQLNANDDEVYRTALLDHAYSIIDGTLLLLHPVMPFLTEELWHGLFDVDRSKSISVRSAPETDAQHIDKDVEKVFELLQLTVESLRRQRAEMQIPPSQRLPVHISAPSDLVPFLEEQREVIASLARCSDLAIGTGLGKPAGSVADVIRSIETFLVVEGAVDLEKEKARLQKELERLTKAIGGVEKKLSNEGFLKGANPDVVETEKQKLADWTDAKGKIERNLATL
jgi:valyl-tRNA synthetase